MVNIENKKCTKCGQEYPATNEYFYKQKQRDNSYTLQSWCKECVKKKALEYQAEHKEEQSVRFKKWHKDNWERNKERCSKWYKENKDNASENRKQWRKSEYGKAYMSNYNKIRSNKNHNITKEEWENCLKYFDYKCAYCNIQEDDAKMIQGQYLHKEHVDCNGENNLSNCVPACRVCNSLKHTTNLEDWYCEDNKIFDKDRLIKIHKWLNEDYKNYINTKN